MADLPGGTLTFLFTDVEGSTLLWEQHPEAMQAMLVRHDALVEACVERHGGMLVRPRGEGDSRFAVFPQPTGAVAAAAAIQQALHAEPWPVASLRVRMALHTGPSTLREGDYYGTEVNRCARLRAIAHGGQTLLSETTYRLVQDALPPGVSLRDLGEHRLRDLTRPERVFQLLHPAIPDAFPPLKATDTRPADLPAQATSFIGREREVEVARRRLLQPDVRLLTLTGPGGTGKTRLALRIAAGLRGNFTDGVSFVGLASIDDPDLVLPAMAQALGLQEGGSAPLRESVPRYLREKVLLLLLDNFEHVLPAAPLVADLLTACPALKVLVTSRTPLRVYGEHAAPVLPLGLPDLARLPPPEQLAGYEAVGLFVARAQAARPDFALSAQNAPAVAALCHRLDGLPLAIELAAARSRLMTPRALLARLEGAYGHTPLQVLVGGERDRPARQQTLRGAIAWSYDLLDQGEQALFRRLAVFAGGCTLPAVEAVCAVAGEPGDPFAGCDPLEPLAALIDHSLLRLAGQPDPQAGTQEPRFGMLQTIREYALERLEAAGETEALRRQHAAYYLALAEEAAPRLNGAQQADWLARLEQEHDNLRVALQWARESGEVECGLQLAGRLGRFWWMRGHLSEGRRWLEELLALAGSDRQASTAQALIWAATLATEQGDFGRAVALAERSLALCQDLGDGAGLALSLNVLGTVAQYQGAYDRATALYERGLALCRDVTDKAGSALLLNNLAVVVSTQGNDERAAALWEESLTLGRELGDSWGIATALASLGDVARDRGDDRRAAALHQESLALRRELGDRWGIADSLASLACVTHAQGEYARAAALYGESLALYHDVGDTWGRTVCLEGLAKVAGAQGQEERAARLLGAAAAQREAIGAPLPPAERAVCDRLVAAARTALGEEAFTRAWAEGYARPSEQGQGRGTTSARAQE